MWGQEGSDEMNGQAGDDRLYGGAGADKIWAVSWWLSARHAVAKEYISKSRGKSLHPMLCTLSQRAHM